MAIIGTNDDENQQAGAAPAAAPTQPGGSSGGGGYVGGGSGQGATTTTAAPTSSGSFTNLTSYLSANEGAGNQMAGAVKGVVGGHGDAADKALTTTAAAGNANIVGGTHTVDPTVLNSIKAGAPTVDKGIVNGIKLGTQTVAPKVSQTGPTAWHTSYNGADDAAEAGGERWTSYEGLQDVLSGNLSAANGGQAGLAALQKNIFSQPSYTAGENNLDSFLTGGSADYQSGLKEMNDKWGGMEAKGKEVFDGFGKAIDAGKKTSTETGVTYQNAFDDAKAKTAAVNKLYAGTLAGKRKADARRAAQIAAAVKASGNDNSGYSTEWQQNLKPNRASGQVKAAAGAITGALADPTQLAADGAGEIYDDVSDTISGGVGKVVTKGIRSGLGMAHGGEVPSYAQLLRSLRGSKK